jgi:hypothetical protein
MTSIYYIVEALRWGDDHDHSYVVGLYDNFSSAVKSAEDHTEFRGGKYICQVIQCKMNDTVDSDMSSSILHQTDIGAASRTRHVFKK